MIYIGKELRCWKHVNNELTQHIWLYKIITLYYNIIMKYVVTHTTCPQWFTPTISGGALYVY